MINSLVTALITVTLGWLSIWVRTKLKRAESKALERDENKRQSLDKMLRFNSEFLSDEKSMTESIADLEEMCRPLVAWAPDEVLYEYANFLEGKLPGIINSITEYEVHFGKAILAFRKEIGFKDRRSKIDPRHLAAIFKAGWRKPL